MTWVAPKMVGTARERAWAGDCTATLSGILSLTGHSPACIPVNFRTFLNLYEKLYK